MRWGIDEAMMEKVWLNPSLRIYLRMGRNRLPDGVRCRFRVELCVRLNRCWIQAS